MGTPVDQVMNDDPDRDSPRVQAFMRHYGRFVPIVGFSTILTLAAVAQALIERYWRR